MKTLFLSIPLTVILSGCASYSQILINAQGQMYRCGAYGQGVYGVAQANQIQDDCLSSMKAAGYIEIEKAGVVGIYFSEQLLTDTLLSVLKVVPNSPAEIAGVRGGDIIISIDNQKVRKAMDAKLLLFGLAGTPVALSLSRDNEIINLNINRAAYTRIFGIPSKSK